MSSHLTDLEERLEFFKKTSTPYEHIVYQVASLDGKVPAGGCEVRCIGFNPTGMSGDLALIPNKPTYVVARYAADGMMIDSFIVDQKRYNYGLAHQ
jgi:hypothetical protein